MHSSHKHVGLFALLSLFTLMRCGDGTVRNPTGTGETATQTISSAGGSVTVANAKLEIPAGAVPAGTTITVTSSVTPAPEQFEAHSPVFKFEPEGTVFEKPVTITLTATEPGGSHLVIFWTKKGSSTEFEELVSTQRGDQVVAEVTHFSSGFIGEAGVGDAGVADGGAADAGQWLRCRRGWRRWL